MDKVATAADFKRWESQARKMFAGQLDYAIADCLECARLGINENYYRDQAATFERERGRRAVKELNRIQRRHSRGRK